MLQSPKFPLVYWQVRQGITFYFTGQHGVVSVTHQEYGKIVVGDAFAGVRWPVSVPGMPESSYNRGLIRSGFMAKMKTNRLYVLCALAVCALLLLPYLRVMHLFSPEIEVQKIPQSNRFVTGENKSEADERYSETPAIRKKIAHEDQRNKLSEIQKLLD